MLSNLSSQDCQAQGTAEHSLDKGLAVVERDGMISSSQAAMAHERLLNNLEEAGQLEAFEDAVQSQAVAGHEDDNDDDDL